MLDAPPSAVPGREIGIFGRVPAGGERAQPKLDVSPRGPPVEDTGPERGQGLAIGRAMPVWPRAYGADGRWSARPPSPAGLDPRPTTPETGPIRLWRWPRGGPARAGSSGRSGAKEIALTGGPVGGAKSRSSFERGKRVDRVEKAS